MTLTWSQTPGRPMYLTAGNFPSRAANTIQVAKMAAAYTRWLPHLQVVALTGPVAWLKRGQVDLTQMFGLARPLRMRYLPLLWRQTELTFDQDYRPPQWFYKLAGDYARLRRADLIFTRKDRTAVTTVQAKINSVLETHVLWEHSPLLQAQPEILHSPYLRALVVISQPLADSFLNAGVPPEKILVEPDGVDLAQFTPAIEKIQARQHLNLKPDQPLCVYTGHLHPDRGIEDIFRAAAHLPEIAFLFVGGWERDVEYHRSLAAAQGLTNVIFRGYVPHAEVPLHLFAADMLLMPYGAKLSTANHCSPLKMFEYLAAGRPIISSDLPILRTVLRHEQNALLISPDSPEALRDAIQGLVDSPRLAEQLAQTARRDSQQYSWDERARRILNHVVEGN